LSAGVVLHGRHHEIGSGTQHGSGSTAGGSHKSICVAVVCSIWHAHVGPWTTVRTGGRYTLCRGL
jgi:hypothetical protein